MYNVGWVVVSPSMTEESGVQSVWVAWLMGIGWPGCLNVAPLLALFELLKRRGPVVKKGPSQWLEDKQGRGDVRKFGS